LPVENPLLPDEITGDIAFRISCMSGSARRRERSSPSTASRSSSMSARPGVFPARSELTEFVYTSGLRTTRGPVNEQERTRGAARRLAIIRHAQEVTGNVSATCRYFGITRQAFYDWLRPYEEHGLEGLRDRSRRPLTSPNMTKGEVVGKIVYLRPNDWTRTFDRWS
jgi:transposase-like protein